MALRLGLGLGLVAWVLSRTGASLPPLGTALGWVAGFALYAFVGAGVEAQRLRVLLAAHGRDLPLGLGYRLVAIGLFFNFFMPGGAGGDVIKTWFLVSGNRGQRVELATLVVLDRALALLAMLVFALLLSLPHLGLIASQPALLALLGMAAAGVAGAGLGGLLVLWQGERLAEGLRGRFPGSVLLARGVVALASFRGREGALARAAGLAMVNHTLFMSIFGTASVSLLGVDSASLGAFLASFGALANVLPVTPGGLGVGEAALEQLFALVGAPGGALLMVAWRLAVLPLCAVGLLFYAVGIRPERRVLEGRP